MQWWGWIIIGALLLGAEITFIDLEFYLVFVGLSAIIVGLINLFGLPIPAWGDWIIFALLCLLTLVFLRRPLFAYLQRDGEGYDTDPVGELLELETDLLPGDTCRVSYRGTSWTAENVGTETISKGRHARIESVDGLQVKVVPITND
jgi:membrane protein implicated in regulation of membrane protease activity